MDSVVFGQNKNIDNCGIRSSNYLRKFQCPSLGNVNKLFPQILALTSFKARLGATRRQNAGDMSRAGICCRDKHTSLQKDVIAKNHAS